MQYLLRGMFACVAPRNFNVTSVGMDTFCPRGMICTDKNRISKSEAFSPTRPVNFRLRVGQRGYEI